MRKGTERIANFWSKLNFLCSLENIAGTVQPLRSTLSDRMQNFSGTSVYRLYFFCVCQKCTRVIIRLLSLHGITDVMGVMLQVFTAQISLWQKGKYPFISWAPFNSLRFRAREVSLRGPDYFFKAFRAQIVRSRDKFKRYFKFFKCSRGDLHTEVAPVTFDLHLKDREVYRKNDGLTTNYMIDNKLQILFTSYSEKESFRFFEMTLAVHSMSVCTCHRSSTLKGPSTNMTKIITLQNKF